MADPSDIRDVRSYFRLPSGFVATVNFQLPFGVMYDWSVAIHMENCIPIMQLLIEYPKLLNVEIDDEFKTLAKRRDKSREPWKRRTALHVGARRGSVELVKQVMKMFEDGGMGWCGGHIEGAPVETVLPLLLGNMLVQRDGKYELDALAMAVINGNREIIQLLMKSSLLITHETNPYGISRRRDAILELESHHYDIPDPMRELKRITIQAMRSACESEEEHLSLKALYDESLDFNFLPWEEYFFHFTFVATSVKLSDLRDVERDLEQEPIEVLKQRTLIRQVRDGIFEGAFSQNLLRLLCELQDGRGRTALHVAVDEGTVKEYLLLRVRRTFDSYSAYFLNCLDGTRRTPLQRAAAMSSSRSLQDLLVEKSINVSENFNSRLYAESLITDLEVNLDLLATRNGFSDTAYVYRRFDHPEAINALEIAILHRRRESVELLLGDKRTNRFSNGRVLLNLRTGRWIRQELSLLQLAVLVGDESIFQLLLEDDKCRQNSVNYPRSALHVVAAEGRFDLLTQMMGWPEFDHFIEDINGNTALHHAVKGKEFELHTHLYMPINCEGVLEIRAQMSKRNCEDGKDKQKEYIERQGCIEFLLQYGFDVWSSNKGKELPYPGPDAPIEYLSWWFNRWTQETIASQRTLNAAANAISVTAILVATASYTGPFQPPLGYNDGDNKMRLGGTMSKVYILCQTMAFYLGVAAVMLSLMTSLLLPQESMIEELKRTRKRVLIAVAFLFPSLICLLLDFAIASILVVPDQHVAFTKSTASLGGFICLGISFLFSIRLLRLVFSKNHRVQQFSKKLL